jgi:hypothetical protein
MNLYLLTAVNAKRGVIMIKEAIAFIAVLIVIFLIVAGFAVLWYEPEEDEAEDGSDMDDFVAYDDKIVPIGERQGFIFEVDRIHKMGIEENFRKIGNAWKSKPSYFFEITADEGTWIGQEINKWDSGYLKWQSLKQVEPGTESSSIEFKIIEPKKQLFRTVNNEVENFKITYDYRTGRWDGDDNFNDTDGYGHYVGDNYEIWFTISIFDNDNDQIPYWTEVNVLRTNPFFDDSKLDPDEDNITSDWEWRWGYDPLSWDNHTYLDPDLDGLENVEEYKMEKWLANPYHKDIYIEVDFMEKGAWYELDHVLWEESQIMVVDKFVDHDITIHIDDGWPGGPTNGGGEYLEYVPYTIMGSDGIASEFYKYHFADERKGIFRYIFIQHGRIGWNGPQHLDFSSDTISLPSNRLWFAKTMFPFAITPRLMRLSQAVCFMHELGHCLGLNSRTVHEGIDNSSQVGRNNLPPLQKLKARQEAIKYWEDYESIMNYNKFGHYLLDYSDGTHGERDFDDWGFIDLTYFQSQSDWRGGFRD